MTDHDSSAEFIATIAKAKEKGVALRIRGGNSKRFLGCRFDGEILDVSGHTGIVEYEPNELVVTVRAGTRLKEIESILAENNQTQGFEPPDFADASTIGGTFACNLSGSARPWRGSVRDAVLGIRLINGNAEHLRFGGRVIKNVAGFDASRLQAGAYGALGLLTELSFKVLPRPETSITIVHETDAKSSVDQMNRLAGSSAPLTGASWIAGRQYIRLAGRDEAVEAAARRIGGDRVDSKIWQQIHEHDPEIFGATDDGPLWRFSVKATSDVLLERDVILDWAGAVRYVRSDSTLDELSSIAASAGGHVMRMSHNSEGAEFMQQPAQAVRKLHRRVKLAFDPAGILNPGRLYGWL